MTATLDTTNLSLADSEQLREKGRSLLRQGQALAALEPLLLASAFLQGVPAHHRSLAECHAEIGDALLQTSRSHEALAHLQEALRLFDELEGAELDRARCLHRIGQAEWGLSHYAAALALHEQALTMLRALPDTARDQAACHMNLGVVRSLLGLREEAISEHQAALLLLQVVPGTEVDQAKCHANIGSCLREMQRPAEGLAEQEMALSLLRDLPHTERLQAQCYARIGSAQGEMGRYEDTITSLERALSLLRRVPGSESSQAFNHANLGTALMFLGRHAEAIRKHSQALALYRSIAGSNREQARCFIVIARNLIRLSRHKEAISHLETALALLVPIHGTEREQAGCTQSIGQVLVELGQSAEALGKFSDALALLEKIGAPALDRAMCHRLSGEALLRDGQFAAAVERFEQALTLYQPEQGQELWQAHHGLGQAREALGDAAGALSAYLTAAEFLEGLRDDIATRANKMAFFQDKAAVYGRLIALLLDGGIADPVAVDGRLARWGERAEEIALGLAETAKARALSDLLQERNQITGAPPEWIAEERRLTEQLSHLSSQLQALGRNSGDPGLALREQIRTIELERDILEVRIKRASPRAALPTPLQTVAEIQALLDPGTALLEYALLPPTRAKTTDDEGRSGGLDPLRGYPVGRSGAQVFRRSRDERPPTGGPTRLEAEGVPASAWGDHRPPTTGESPPNRTPERPNTQCLTPNTQRPTPNAPSVTHIVLWIVTGDAVRVFRIALPATGAATELGTMAFRLRQRAQQLTLEERIRLYHHDMVTRAKRTGALFVRDHQKAGKVLADTVLPPEAREYLAERGIGQIAVVPDGILHHVPFPALILERDPEREGTPRYELCRFLIHDFAVVCLPSATTLAALRQAARERRARGPDRRRSLLAFADPVFSPRDPRWGVTGHGSRFTGPETAAAELGTRDPRPATLDEAEEVEVRDRDGGRLRATADEVRAVAGLFPDAEICVGLDATKERLRALPLTDFRYLIFATHASVDEENPMLSSIRLTATEEDNGLLQAQEIFALELDAEMVTLSACRSGLGRLASGEGIVGLSTAFFTAGARSLLTSLWEVGDPTTALLVQRLYTHLRDGNLSPARALRRAQLEMIGFARESGEEGERERGREGEREGQSGGTPSLLHSLAPSLPRSLPLSRGDSLAHPYYWAFTLMGDWADWPPAA
jgi:CHAT domain-containing protein/tetratricopeptide (TPR) repeat protein